MNESTKQIQIQEDNKEIEIDLVELLSFYRSRIVIILAVFVIGALLAGVITKYAITPKYTATSKVYMVSASSDSMINLTDLNIGTSLSTDYEELLRTRPIFEEVIHQLSLSYKYEQLLDMVAISTITDTRILTISVESEKADEAQLIANALADKAVSELPELMDTSKPNIAEKAILPPGPSSPSLVKNVLIGALAATALVLVILTILFLTDDTLLTSEDVEKTFGIMPLTVIPEGEVEEISDKKEKEIRRNKKARKSHRKEKSND